jgi:hypothetical protein
MEDRVYYAKIFQSLWLLTKKDILVKILLRFNFLYLKSNIFLEFIITVKALIERLQKMILFLIIKIIELKP